MALPDSFLDELRARTPLAAVIGRRVKLARSGRDWKGCCPFHDEKTPSFYVYEDGYHCFGCGAHGDAIAFVMHTQGAGFPEAVSLLAAEAGLEVPRASPAAAAAERRRADLHGVMDAVVAAHQRRLRSAEGRPALDYLRGRGLSDATIDLWRLGWSGDGRGALAAELAGQDITTAQLVEAGVMREGDEGRPARELFFGRVVFPIHDERGRPISLGGRVLGDGQPKYLNGPETALFSKSRTLFGLDRARAAARAGAAVLAVEGYMDVIALHQAGFAGAVAPLGTALTEAQLDLLWRLSPAPVLCFDGDAAGARAAMRALELALPRLTPERTLRLARLANDDDPDSVVRRQGKDGLQALLDAAAARPLTDALFDMLRERTGSASPEQRAALLTRLDEAAARIQDRALSREYRDALRGRFYAGRAADRARNAGKASWARPVPRAPQPRPRPTDSLSDVERCHILVCILLNHPSILRDEEETFARFTLTPPLVSLRAGMLAWVRGCESLDSVHLMNHLAETGLGELAMSAMSLVARALPEEAKAAAMPAAAQACWWHFVGFLRRSQLEDELAAARAQFQRDGDEKSQRRLIALRQAHHRLSRGDHDDDESGFDRPGFDEAARPSGASKTAAPAMEDEIR